MIGVLVSTFVCWSMETVVCTGDCGTESNVYLHTGELLKVSEGADDILKNIVSES